MCKRGLRSEDHPTSLAPCQCCSSAYTTHTLCEGYIRGVFRQRRRGRSGGRGCEQCKHTRAIRLLVSFSAVSSVRDVFTNTLKPHFSNRPLFNLGALRVSKVTHANQGSACAWSLAWVLYKETVFSPQFLHQLLQSFGPYSSRQCLIHFSSFFLMIYQKTKTKPQSQTLYQNFIPSPSVRDPDLRARARKGEGNTLSWKLHAVALPHPVHQPARTHGTVANPAAGWWLGKLV